MPEDFSRHPWNAAIDSSHPIPTPSVEPSAELSIDRKHEPHQQSDSTPNPHQACHQLVLDE
jgi:hypothetical protein